MHNLFKAAILTVAMAAISTLSTAQNNRILFEAEASGSTDYAATAINSVREVVWTVRSLQDQSFKVYVDDTLRYDLAGTVFQGAFPKINDMGYIVFHSSVEIQNTLRSGLFDGLNPDLSGGLGGDTIALDVWQNRFDLNNQGDVAWLEFVSGTQLKTVKTRSNGVVVTGPTSNFLLEVAVNDQRRVAWLVSRPVGSRIDAATISNGELGPVETLVTWKARISTFRQNRDGEIAFIGEGEGSSSEGVWLVNSDGQISPLAVEPEIDPESPFGEVNTSVLSLNDSGVVLFEATRLPQASRFGKGSGSDRGLYLSTDLSRPYVTVQDELLDGVVLEEVEAEWNADLLNEDNELALSGRLFRTSPEVSRTDAVFVVAQFPDIIPEPSQELYWVNPAGGAFDVPENWDSEVVPDEDSWAYFDLDASYTVNGAGEGVARAIFQRGSASLQGNLAAIEPSTAAPSLTISSQPNLPVAATLQSSAIVNTVNTAVSGVATGGNTSLVVTGGGQLVNTGQFVLGRESGGTGSEIESLSIRQAGKVSTGELIVGRGGITDVDVLVEGVGSELSFSGIFDVGAASGATLTVREGAKVSEDGSSNGLLRTGFGLDTEGKTLVTGTGSEVRAGTAVIGANGRGELMVEAGGEFRTESNLILAAADLATASVESRGPASEIHVGADLLMNRAGAAVMTIDDRAALSVGGDLFIQGAVTTDDNELSVKFGSTLSVAGRFLVQHDARVQFLEADIVTDDVMLATGEDGGPSSVFVTDSSWNALGATVVLGRDDFQSQAALDPSVTLVISGTTVLTCTTVVVNRGSMLEGNGTVNASVQGTGTIDPQGTLTINGPATGGIDRGPVGDRTLTIDGDLASDGTIVIDADSSMPGGYDVLDIGGDVTLEGASILIRFVPGYAPAVGDQFEFVQAGGSITTNSLQLQYAGIEEGFQYAVAADGQGNLVIEALSDGIAWADDTLFRSGFQGAALTVR